MPRDLNGDYTLPPGNPVVTNTTITVSWANDTMNDLGLEVTNSLSRFGFGGMLAPLVVPPGSATARGYGFNSAAGAGMSLIGTDDLRFGYVGEDVLRVSPLGVQQWNGTSLTWENLVVDGGDPSFANISCTTLTATGDIQSTTGNLVATAGSCNVNAVNCSTTVSCGGLTAVTGNINAVVGDVGCVNVTASGNVDCAQLQIDAGTATVGGSLSSSGATMTIRGGAPAASGSAITLNDDTASDGNIEISRGDMQMLFAINGAIAAPDVFIYDNAPTTPVQRLVGYRPNQSATSTSTTYTFTEGQLNGYFQYTGSTAGVDLQLPDALGKPGDFFEVYNMSSVSVDVVCIGGTFAVMQGVGAPANVSGVPLVGGGHIHFVKGATNQWLATGAGMTGFPPV